MIQSRHKSKLLIVRFLLLTLGIAMLIFALSQILAFTNGDESANFGKAMMLTLVAVPLIHSMVDSLKSVTVDTISGKLKITYMGIYEETLTRQDIIGYQTRPFINRTGTFNGILIELKSGQQYQFTEQEFQNYSDIENALAQLSFYRGDLELKYLTPAIKILIGYFCTVIMIVVLYEIYK
ncbi:hypothetical protein [Cesiribacter sp. SM1]|uniref:hypothetical protein n=1 Tax=Cesiribacter sp. SM1 TaxID=2861196 RepID=UPI001CD4F099|nr:hypothetical protein [Cesiribacter sp. SM1]